MHCSQIGPNLLNSQIVTSAKRKRTFHLPEELDKKLHAFITHMRMGLIKLNLITYGMYLEFQITDGWIQSLYKRMNPFRLMITTARPIITRLI